MPSGQHHPLGSGAQWCAGVTQGVGSQNGPGTQSGLASALPPKTRADTQVRFMSARDTPEQEGRRRGTEASGLTVEKENRLKHDRTRAGPQPPRTEGLTGDPRAQAQAEDEPGRLQARPEPLGAAGVEEVWAQAGPLEGGSKEGMRGRSWASSNSSHGLASRRGGLATAWCPSTQPPGRAVLRRASSLLPRLTEAPPASPPDGGGHTSQMSKHQKPFLDRGQACPALSGGGLS